MGKTAGAQVIATSYEGKEDLIGKYGDKCDDCIKQLEKAGAVSVLCSHGEFRDCEVYLTTVCYLSKKTVHVATLLCWAEPPASAARSLMRGQEQLASARLQMGRVGDGHPLPTATRRFLT
jgi:hypothetical protein